MVCAHIIKITAYIAFRQLTHIHVICKYLNGKKSTPTYMYDITYLIECKRVAFNTRTVERAPSVMGHR